MRLVRKIRRAGGGGEGFSAAANSKSRTDFMQPVALQPADAAAQLAGLLQ